ncbi:ATP-binding cassette domain-containing protein [Pseudomonas mohnii]
MSNAAVATAHHPAIVSSGLSKWFGEGNARMKAVDEVALVAQFGEMVFIVGPSGSGKTALPSMISDILRPDAGTVTINAWKWSDSRIGGAFCRSSFPVVSNNASPLPWRSSRSGILAWRLGGCSSRSTFSGGEVRARPRQVV